MKTESYGEALAFLTSAEKMTLSPDATRDAKLHQMVASGETALLDFYAQHHMVVPSQAELDSLIKAATYTAIPSEKIPNVHMETAASTPVMQKISTSTPLFILLGAAIVLFGGYLLLRRK
jgi:LPXTG-motif cell wall-anchored protein